MITYSTAPKRGSVFIGLMTPDGSCDHQILRVQNWRMAFAIRHL